MVNTHSPTGPGPSVAPQSISSTHILDWYDSLKKFYFRMTADQNLSCTANCSGRGECLDGTCVCQVQYEGLSCHEPNLAYFISFATVFYLIALVCLVQLLICIHSEYSKMKTPSLKSACSITTQKVLYLIMSVAAVLRGAYFSTPTNPDLTLDSIFISAFYPIILTAGSLIVCFWAEAFHLRDIRCEKPRFLSKSMVGFFTFNLITYALFAAEVILTKKTNDDEERDFLSHVFHGCYAALLFIVVVFFLIYGVEVYFKVRGGFVSDTLYVEHVHSRPPKTDDESSHPPLLAGPSNVESPAVTRQHSTITPAISPPDDQEVESSIQLIPNNQKRGEFVSVSKQHGINTSQLNQSRIGLVTQAFMLMVTVCFLISEVLGQFWKNRVHLLSMNAYIVLFRVVELGVATWFPCVLWNSISPEQLWILNPKKILRHLDIDRTIEPSSNARVKIEHSSKDKTDDTSSEEGECWICYDSERNDAGPLIQPCDCIGDVGYVHHDCLRKWLMECAEKEAFEKLSCKVCEASYKLERGQAWWIGQGFTARHWLQTASLVTVMCGTIAGFWAIIQLYDGAIVRSCTAGVSLLILYVCMRFLGFNTFTAYQRAKFFGVKIISRGFGIKDSERTTAILEESFDGTIPTISSEVRIEPRADSSNNPQTRVNISHGGLPRKMPQSTI